jgi:hypothetical protein
LFFSQWPTAIDDVLEDLQNPKNPSLQKMMLKRESDIAGFLGIHTKKLVQLS